MNSSKPTVLYVDHSIGFGGSSKSLALTLKGLPNVHKLLLTTQEPTLVRELFGTVKTWRYRKYVNYHTRAQLTKRLESRPPGLKRIVMKLYAVADAWVSFLTFLKTLSIIKRHNVELVHINNSYVPREAAVAARIAGVKCVSHFRGFAEPPVDPRLSDSARAVDCTIAVSDAGFAGIREAVPDVRSVTVYDPVDLDVAAAAAADGPRVRSELGATDGDLLVGLFGRVVRWKGQLEFVRAMLEALEEDPRLLGVIVGGVSDGPGDYLEEVRELISASEFPDRFVLTGYRDDVDAFYAAIDIAVHASISPEPFGMVIPEAMAAGRPVIATDAGGPREIITHGVDGLRVPIGDTSAMANAIIELAGDADRRREMGEKARRTVQERFTIEQNASAIHEIYRDLLNDRSG